jgi:diguanylate cyclase (GGDEF)-like protein/PAS domain S-box-containing protein
MEILLALGFLLLVAISLIGGLKWALAGWVAIGAALVVLRNWSYAAGFSEISLIVGIAAMLPIIIIIARFKDIYQKLQSSYQKLAGTNQHLQVLLDNVPEVVWSVHYPSLRFIYINQACRTVFGVSPEDFYQQPRLMLKFIYPPDRRKVKNFLRLLGKTKAAQSFTLRIMTKSGEIKWIENKVKPILDAQGRIVYLDSIITDITDKKKIEKKLWQEREFSKLIVENTPAVIIAVDKDSHIIMLNKGMEELTGYRREQVLGKSYLDLFVPKDDRQKVQKVFADVFAGVKNANTKNHIAAITGEVHLISWSITSILDIDKKIIAIVGIGMDITKEELAKKELAQKHRQLLAVHHHVRELSERDSLTELYNRRYFEKYLQELNYDAVRPVSIILADINGLKLINDIYGHLKGDQVIKQIAKHLSGPLRQEDVVARIGGDEFAIVLPKVDYPQAETVKERILKQVEQDISVLNGLGIGLSIGVATALGRSQMETAMIKADDLMYQEKFIGSERAKSELFRLLEEKMVLADHQAPERLSMMEQFALCFASHLKLTEEDNRDLLTLIKYHDIGNSVIGQQIFVSSRKLSHEEQAVVRSHVDIGRRICTSFVKLNRISHYLYHHHEHWDGSGYPSGIAGQDIPIIARVFAIIDAFEAMTGTRPYRPSKTWAEAVQELEAKAGSQFDPMLVDLFVNKILLVADSGQIC